MGRLRRKITTARTVLRRVWTHPANHDRKVAACVSVVIFELLSRVFGYRRIVRLGDHSRLWADVRHYSSALVLQSNPPDWAEMRQWRNIIRPGDLFLDVGANVGVYSLWMAECGARVIAVEPDPFSADELAQNLALNPYTIEVHRVVLAEVEGDVTFSTGGDSTNSLVHDGNPGRTVRATTLDAILGERLARGAKIDVEGAERLVLCGGAKALAEGRLHVLQLEWNRCSEAMLGEDRRPVADLLRSYGYRLFRPGPHGWAELLQEVDYGTDVFAFAPGLYDDRDGTLR